MRASVRVANPAAQGNRAGARALSNGRTAGRAMWVLPVAEQELVCWDPKDGELCLCRVKSLETVMEARSDTDVQIVRLT